MPLPAIGIVAKFVLANGARQATIKYGPKAVKKAQQQIAKRQKAIANKQDPTTPYSKASQARSAETAKVKAREKRLEKERGKEYFDIDGEPLDEVPLRFDMYAGGLLSDDNTRYGMLTGGQTKLDMNNSGDLDAQDFEMLRDQKSIGGLVKKLFKLAKKKQPKEVKEQDIDDILNSLSDEQMEKLTSVEIEQLLDMDLAKSGVDNIPTKSTKKDIDDILDNLTDKEIENLTPIEREQLLDMEIEKYGIKGR